MPAAARRRAEQLTGLSWLQIYKWMFDRKQRMKEAELERLLDYKLPIFRVLTRDGKDITPKMRPIFKTERVKRTVLRASGQPSTQRRAARLQFR